MKVRKDNILVRPIEEDIRNGLFIPPAFRQGRDNQLGKVEFCGPDSVVSVGDTVIFGRWSGEEIIYKQMNLLLLKPLSIFAIK